MIQCTKTVFNQYKWPSSNFWPLCCCAGVCNDITDTQLQDGDLCMCNKTQDLEHWVKVAGDLSALKVTTGDLNFLMQTFLSAFQEIPDTHFNFHDMIVSKTYNVEQSTQIILQIWWVCRDIHNWWSSLRVLMKSDNSICIKYSIRTRNYVIVLITFC